LLCAGEAAARIEADGSGLERSGRAGTPEHLLCRRLRARGDCASLVRAAGPREDCQEHEEGSCPFEGVNWGRACHSGRFYR
jgi:hypothetical protein